MPLYTCRFPSTVPDICPVSIFIRSAIGTDAGAQETAMVDRRTSAISRKLVNLFITYLLIA
jgi:hypothetical protein